LIDGRSTVANRGSTTVLEIWRAKVKAVKREVVAIALAARDPRTPWAARVLILAIVAYAASPIDLIPDFIPVLGFLDELLLLPAALYLAIRMIPAEAMADARVRAANERLSPSRAAAAIIVLLWVAISAAGIYFAWGWFSA
jgi:uncharacterized membrane protein YkvA (DUF1232 family)